MYDFWVLLTTLILLQTLHHQMEVDKVGFFLFLGELNL